MAKIRVDPAVLTTNSTTISSTALSVSTAGKLAQSAAMTAPSYDGQFGIRVKAIGAEAMSRAQSTTGRLNTSAFSLNTRANAFLNADNTYIKPTGGTLVTPTPPPLPPRIAEIDVVDIEKGVEIDQGFAWLRGVTIGKGVVDVVDKIDPSYGLKPIGKIAFPIKIGIDIIKDFIKYGQDGGEKVLSAITVDLIISIALIFLGKLIVATIIGIIGLLGGAVAAGSVPAILIGVVVGLALSFLFEIPALKEWKEGAINSITDGIKNTTTWLDNSFNNAINIISLPMLPGLGLFRPITESINAIRWAPFF